MSTNDFRNCASGRPEIMAVWNKVCDSMDSEESEWIASLRAQGIKAAHPNDGWVDREKNTITFAYPQFDDGAEAGDLMMLGLGYKNDRSKGRLVRLIKRDNSGFFVHAKKFVFEDVKP